MSIKGLVEAAHIISYSFENIERSLDTKNGLALCKNCHSLYDNFSIEITPDFHVELPKKIENNESAYDKLYLSQIKGKKLNLPLDEENKPDKECLKLHKKNDK